MCMAIYMQKRFWPPGCAAAGHAGVLFNVLFPEWLQTALLVVLLGVVVKKTATKGAKQWQQEQKAKAQAAEVRVCMAAPAPARTRLALPPLSPL